MASEPIAIVGLGAVLPNGRNADAVWRSMLAREAPIGTVPPEIWDAELWVDPTRSDPHRPYTALGAVVRGFEFRPQDYGMPPAVGRHLDPIQKVALEAARQALQSAGIDGPTEGLRGAVVLGNLQGGVQLRGERWFRCGHPVLEATIEGLPSFGRLSESTRRSLLDELRRAWAEQFTPLSSDSMTGLLGNVAASRIAHYFNLHGPASAVDAACASSLAALDVAVGMLREGRVDLAVTGGVDMMMDAPSYAGFCTMGALSPEGSYPFDRRANGFVMGEGGACFVLKRLSDARADGDRVYATIRGVGASSDGRGRSLVAPNPDGQVRAMREAWAAAGLAPADVGYIEAHGTATPLGDPTEIFAMRQVFGEAAEQSIPIGSVKANIGHLKGAAGAAGLLRAVLALYHRTVPPEAGFEEPNPNCELETSPFRVPVEPEELGGAGLAAVSAFGFGGVNVHVVLEAGDRAGSSADWASRPVGRADALPLGLPVVGFGANSREELLAVAKRLRDRAAEESPEHLARDCARGVSPSAFRYRVALHAESDESATAQLDALIKVLTGQGSGARLEAMGVALRDEEPIFGPDAACFMFPGQGSQYVGMLDELKARYPVVAQTFDEADAVMASVLPEGESLSAIVSPPKDTNAGEAFLRLMRTEVLQPAMLTADEALRRLFEPLVTPRAVLGHSLGEYGACVAAGVLRFEDCLRIVAARGDAMEQVSFDDKGLMLGVGADEATVAAALEGIEGYVAIVNKNCTSQTIIGGATGSVKAAQAVFREQGLQCMQLPVSHAFHSEIVAPASEPLRRALDRVDVAAPSVPILSNVTGDFYPEHLDEEATAEWIRATLAKQVASPVEFIRDVETAYAAGCRVFVEVGPKRALAGFVSDILRDRPHRSLFLAHPKFGEVTTLGRTLAALVADGVVAYGRARAHSVREATAGRLEPRPPQVRTVEPAPRSERERGAPAEERPATATAPRGNGARLGSGEVGAPGVMEDSRFWQFLALQGPALVQSLVASYQAATSALGAPPTGVAASAHQQAVTATVPPAGAPAPAVPAPSPAPASVRAAQERPGGSPGVGANGWPDDVAHWIVGRVAEVTGYTRDELDLDADLESELGIDSIRQIEVMLAVRDELGLPASDGFRPSDYPTMRALIDYVERQRPGAVGEAEALVERGGPNGDLTGWLLDRVSEATGYTKDELDLDADLESELGIDSIRQIEIILSIRDELGLDGDTEFKPGDYPTLRSVAEFLGDHLDRNEGPSPF